MLELPDGMVEHGPAFVQVAFRTAAAGARLAALPAVDDKGSMDTGEARLPVFGTGRILTQVAGELDVMGFRLVRRSEPAAAVAAWIGQERAAAIWSALRRLPVLRVGPGPLLSPYDGPTHGYASLRVAGPAARPGSASRPAGLADDLERLRRLGLTSARRDDEDEAGLERFAREWLDGVAYFDSWTRRPLPLAEAAEQVAWLRSRFGRDPRPVVLVGISRWKRRTIDRLFLGPAGPPLHVADAHRAVRTAQSRRGRVAVWATRMPASLPNLCGEADVAMSRIEDGFLRSVGLGASFEVGAAIVEDRRGIYYDPDPESDLVHILREEAFAPELVERGRRLRETIVARGLSKYNVGLRLAPEADAFGEAGRGRRRILVPGQVEDDASVLRGSPNVRSNEALLAAARARNPDAFIIYKPHPDVEAGFRNGRLGEAQARRHADAIVTGVSVSDLLKQVDAVETMTSLLGFEALLLGRKVAVHGRPFYAGWGLTDDLAPGSDRGRRLALDELVAGALIVYSHYLDPVSLKPCGPELVIDRLSEARAARPASRVGLTRPDWALTRWRYGLLDPVARALRARRGVRNEGRSPARPSGLP